ncbi:MAG: lipoate--protein ligase family protein [Armatimonadetes bacterium]|nr:lipoate--protein ligase family protein [Armatimonadota bacterium]
MPPSLPVGLTERAFAERLGARPWRLIRTDAAPGAWNMGVDVALLEEALRGGYPVLRFYAWEPPAISLGRFQCPDAGIHWPAVRRRGWEVVRRPTGGRAVLHQHELTYAVILPSGVVGGIGVRRSYAVLAEGLRAGLAALAGGAAGAAVCGGGAPTRHAPANCFAQALEADCVLEGGKALGSAQVRHGGALLQHGSLLLDADRDAWREIFGSEGQLRSLREITGRKITFCQAAAVLAQAFADTWHLHLCSDALTPAEMRAAEREAAKWSVGWSGSAGCPPAQ